MSALRWNRGDETPRPGLATHAEGYELYLSDRNATGYLGVEEKSEGYFVAKVFKEGMLKWQSQLIPRSITSN